MFPYDRKSEELIEAFRDRDYRETYAEDFLNTCVATQIRVLREQRGLTQAQLAQAIGTKQTAISRMENVNNTARNIGTLLKIAFQLGCRLKVSFETFGSLIEECVDFSRESLQRPSFEQDPAFQGGPVPYGNQTSSVAAFPASILGSPAQHRTTSYTLPELIFGTPPEQSPPGPITPSPVKGPMEPRRMSKTEYALAA